MVTDLPDYVLPKVVDIDHLALIDLISEITLLRTIEQIAQIDNITNIDTIGTLLEVTGMQHLTTLGIVDNVTHANVSENLIRNGSFEVVGWDGGPAYQSVYEWTVIGEAQLSGSFPHTSSGAYCVMLLANSGIEQYLKPLYADECTFALWLYSLDETVPITVTLTFTDDTTETFNFTSTASSWVHCLCEPTAHKRVKTIKIMNTDAVKQCFIDDVYGVNTQLISGTVAISGTVTADITDDETRKLGLVGPLEGSIFTFSGDAVCYGYDYETPCTNPAAIRQGTNEWYVAVRYSGAEIDPRSIRALTNADIISVEQSDQTKLKATVTQASIARTVTGTVTAEQSDETKLKATVTQAAKDRTISSVDATATALQISLSALNGNSSALVTPASGKALRIKFISLEHSADVDLGFRFAAAGTIYYLRITKGLYVSNLIGANAQGAADEALYLNSSAATNVKGYILYSEV